MSEAKVKEAIGNLRAILDELEGELGIGESEGLIHADLWVDGGSRGNPGPGYGSWFIRVPGIGNVQDRQEFGRTTNNEAEYKALLGGLEAIKKRVTGNLSQLNVTIYTDSALVVGQVQGGWKVKAENLWPLWNDVGARLSQFGAWRLVKKPRAEMQAMLGH